MITYKLEQLIDGGGTRISSEFQFPEGAEMGLKKDDKMVLINLQESQRVSTETTKMVMDLTNKNLQAVESNMTTTNEVAMISKDLVVMARKNLSIVEDSAQTIKKIDLMMETTFEQWNKIFEDRLRMIQMQFPQQPLSGNINNSSPQYVPPQSDQQQTGIEVKEEEGIVQEVEGVLLESHKLRWKGQGLLEENEECMFKHRISINCPGLCNDKAKRQVAIAVAMDCVPTKNKRVTFADVDFVNDTPRRIYGKGGRGIVVIEGAQNVVATDYCMAVCCHDLALYLMQGRWNARLDMTENLVSTEWPDDLKSTASKFGRPDNRHKSGMEVEFAQMISNEQHEKVTGRTVNMIALPPLKTETVPGVMTQIPYARWRQEIDMGLKSKAYRKDIPTEILMPVKHFDQWLLIIWDFGKMTRETLIFKENVLESYQWGLLTKLDKRLMETTKKFEITEGQLLQEKTDKFKVAPDPVEVWNDIGEIKGDVFEHGRLISTMNLIMNEGSRSEGFIRQALTRDIGDLGVLRRLRLIQLAALAGSARVKLVYISHGKAFREKALGKAEPPKKQGGVISSQKSAKSTDCDQDAPYQGGEQEGDIN